jgi:hypothetical protein
MAPYLTRAGLSSIATQVTQLPLGAHGGMTGIQLAANYLDFFSSLRGGIIDRGLAGHDEFGDALARARNELDAGAYTLPWYTVYGHKAH